MANEDFEVGDIVQDQRNGLIAVVTELGDEELFAVYLNSQVSWQEYTGWVLVDRLQKANHLYPTAKEQHNG